MSKAINHEKKIQALDLETLDQVSGGALTESKELQLDEEITSWEKQFGSRDNIIKYLDTDYDKTDLSKRGISLEDAKVFVDSYYA